MITTFQQTEDKAIEGMGLTGWLSDKGQFHKCQWGFHHVVAKLWVETEVENLDTYIKMGSDKEDISKSYFFISRGITDQQEEWIEDNWHSLDKEQQENYLDYKQSCLTSNTSVDMEKYKEEYLNWKTFFSPLYQIYNLELHDWIALESVLNARLCCKKDKENRLIKILTKWKLDGFHLLEKYCK